MAAAIGVRSDYTSAGLRQFARRSEDPDQVRRLLAVALILDGGSRSEAAKVAGVTLQIVRDWVMRFNEGGPDGLVTRKAPGRASILNDEQRNRLAALSRRDRSPRRTAWCAGDLPIWRNGSGMSSRSLSRATHSGASCARWAAANSRRAPAIVARSLMTLPILKKLRRPPGADQAEVPERNPGRAVVAGRSPRWSADQTHPAVG